MNLDLKIFLAKVKALMIYKKIIFLCKISEHRKKILFKYEIRI
jgi:hypothetical protein